MTFTTSDYYAPPPLLEAIAFGSYSASYQAMQFDSLADLNAAFMYKLIGSITNDNVGACTYSLFFGDSGGYDQVAANYSNQSISGNAAAVNGARAASATLKTLAGGESMVFDVDVITVGDIPNFLILSAPDLTGGAIKLVNSTITHAAFANPVDRFEIYGSVADGIGVGSNYNLFANSVIG